MICLGLSEIEKVDMISQYVKENGIKSVISITGLGASLTEDDYPFKEIIEYKSFYHLLQTIDVSTLLVVNECLRTQNRYDLAYNCVRNFLTQTQHKLIFQRFPFIDQPEDFMILFDFETRSQWKRESYDLELLKQADIIASPQYVKFDSVTIGVSAATKRRYKKKRDQLFAELGARDPHTIPRNLYLVSTADKKKSLQDKYLYVARNKRFKAGNISTYREVDSNKSYKVIDLPHRFIDFSDYLFVTRQSNVEVLVVDLKVERWYFQRYTEWSERLNAFYSEI